METVAADGREENMRMPNEREIEYFVDGSRMVGLMVRPDGEEAMPIALVAHEAPGLSDHTRNVARQLAEIGIISFALDYQGDGTAKSDVEAVTHQIRGWVADPTVIVTRLQAALKLLRAEPGADWSRTYALGYCFGGSAVLELARTGEELAAVIGFHPGLPITRTEASRRIRAPVVMFLGGRDEITPASQRRAFEDEMSEAGVDWRTVVFGTAKHSFTNPDVDAMNMPIVAYDAHADQASWRAMVDFLVEKGGLAVAGIA
jgi:dienelactone hydrolase